MGKFDTDRSAVDEMLDDNESNNSESLATKATDKAKSELKDKAGKEFEIEGDTVIASMGYHPAPVFAKSGKVKLIGDCDKVGNLRTAIWKAWDVAMKI